jgi:tetratricopeptide (TPR) repeat protein
MLTWLKSTFHFNVATYHLGVGQFREAVAGFSEVIRLSPSYTAYLNRGVALQGMNDHPRAISDFDRAIAIGSKLDLLRAAAYGGRGISWKAVGDFDRADADYKQALALAPRFSPGYEELGVIAHLRYDFDVAIAHLDYAIKLAPRHASPSQLVTGLAAHARAQRA